MFLWRACAVAWCLYIMSIDVLGRYIPLISKCLTVDIPRPSHCPVFDAQKYSKTGWWGKAWEYVRQPPHNSTKSPSYVINNGQRFESISVVILVVVGSNIFSIFTCASFRTVGGKGGKSRVLWWGGGH